MRFAGDRKAILLIWLIAVLWVTGCETRGRTGPSSGRAGALVSISAYRYDPGFLQLVLDVPSGRLTATEKYYDTRSGLFMYATRESRLGRREVDALARRIAAVKQDLRGFRPKLEWFRGIPPPHTGDVVQIKWEDRTVAIARPPDSMCREVPGEARKLYSSLRNIQTEFSELTGRLYDGGVAVGKVEPEHPLGKAFEDDWASMQMHSLPRGRVGW